MKLLVGTDEWDLNIFKLHKLTDGQPLTILGMKLIHDRGLITSLKLNVVRCPTDAKDAVLYGMLCGVLYGIL